MDANRKSMTLVADQLAMARQVAVICSQPPSIMTPGHHRAQGGTQAGGRIVAWCRRARYRRRHQTNGKPCASSTRRATRSGPRPALNDVSSDTCQIERLAVCRRAPRLGHLGLLLPETRTV